MMQKLLTMLFTMLSLTFVSAQTKDDTPQRNWWPQGSWIHPDAAKLADGKTSYGDGSCVAFVKINGMPHTSTWRPGVKIQGNNNLKSTLVIANFKNGRFPNQSGWHAAVYDRQDSEGIWVWDQWEGVPAAHRYIRFKRSGVTPNKRGEDYYVVETE